MPYRLLYGLVISNHLCLSKEAYCGSERVRNGGEIYQYVCVALLLIKTPISVFEVNEPVRVTKGKMKLEDLLMPEWFLPTFM